MGLNYFKGRDRAWLEQQLRFAQDDLAKGKTVTGVNAGDSGNTKQVQENARERIRLLMEALHEVAPDDYSADEVSRITETRFAPGGC
jgi:hypothetical protein